MWPFPSRTSRQRKPARRVPSSPRLRVRSLEDRCLLSSGWAVSNLGSGTFSQLPALSQPDTAGNLYLTGYFTGSATFGSTTLNASTESTYVAKVDPNGNFLWAEQLGGAPGNTFWDGIALDGGGNVYVTGNFSGTAAFGGTTLTSAGGADIYVAKLDPNGNVLWARSAGGAGTDWAMRVAADGSGNVYLTSQYAVNGATFGSTTLAAATGNGGNSLALSKLDSNGNWLWSERLSSNTGQLEGLTVDAGGNAYVTGVIYGSPDQSFLGKYGPNAGPALWTDTSLGTNGNQNTGWGLTTYQEPVTGATAVYDVGNGGNVQKVDASSGAVIWSEALGAPNYSNVIGRAAAVDASGNLYVAGEFWGTCDFDPGSGTANLTGTTGQYGIYNSFLAKFDSAGNFLSGRSFFGVNINASSGLALDSSGNMYTAGNYQGTADFDTGSQTVPLTSPGSTSLYVCQTTQDTGAIFGQVFSDLNGNGTFDPSSSNPETGMPNVTVYIDLNNTGTYQAGDPTATTDANGDYEFNHLAAGSYAVRQVPPAGWKQTYPSAGAADTVTLGAGQFTDGVNFGDYIPSQTKTYSSTNVPVKIFSQSSKQVSSTLTISDAYPVFDLVINLNITGNNGTSPSAFTMALHAPDGTSTSVSAPSTHLTVFNGHEVKGTWTLTIDGGGSGGTLKGWSLTVLGPVIPQIGSFTASPNPVTAGGNVTLTASNVTDANAGSTITQMAFYVDSNKDGVLDSGDALLGYGTLSGGKWTFTFSTAGWAKGTYTLFAQAGDNNGLQSDPFALKLTVQ
jgi:hypothetical protein